MAESDIVTDEMLKEVMSRILKGTFLAKDGQVFLTFKKDYRKALPVGANKQAFAGAWLDAPRMIRIIREVVEVDEDPSTVTVTSELYPFPIGPVYEVRILKKKSEKPS